MECLSILFEQFTLKRKRFSIWERKFKDKPNMFPFFYKKKALRVFLIVNFVEKKEYLAKKMNRIAHYRTWTDTPKKEGTDFKSVVYTNFTKWAFKKRVLLPPFWMESSSIFLHFRAWGKNARSHRAPFLLKRSEKKVDSIEKWRSRPHVVFTEKRCLSNTSGMDDSIPKGEWLVHFFRWKNVTRRRMTQWNWGWLNEIEDDSMKLRMTQPNWGWPNEIEDDSIKSRMTQSNWGVTFFLQKIDKNQGTATCYWACETREFTACLMAWFL